MTVPQKLTSMSKTYSTKSLYKEDQRIISFKGFSLAKSARPDVQKVCTQQTNKKWNTGNLHTPRITSFLEYSTIHMHLLYLALVVLQQTKLSVSLITALQVRI